MDPDQLRRFESKVHVEPNTGCWLWLGHTVAGYGQMWLGVRFDHHAYAHRVSYEHYVGPIPDGLHLDHLCRRPCCVNPAHLEPVTAEENNRRALAARRLEGAATPPRARKSRCLRGHDLNDEANVYVDRRGVRTCRSCHREHQRRYRAEAQP